MTNAKQTAADSVGGVLVFKAHGTPRAQPRPRFDKKRVISTADPKAKMWKAAVKRSAADALANIGGKPVLAEMLGGIDSPLRLDAVFRIPTKDSSRWGHYHAMKPDRDNLEKLAQDAMAEAGLFRGGAAGVKDGDDCRVCCGEIEKVWCKPSEAGADFRLSRAVSSRVGISSAPIVRGKNQAARRKAVADALEKEESGLPNWISHRAE